MHPAAERSHLARWTVLPAGWTRLVLLNGAIGICYFGAARLGFMLSSPIEQVTAVWPPTGIAIVAALWFGSSCLYGVFASAFLVNLETGEAVHTALGIAVGNVAGPWFGAYALKRVARIDLRLSRVRDVLWLFVFGAFGAMAIPATNGATWLAAAGIVDWANFFSVWRVWWIGDAMGVLVLAPLLLTWFSEPHLHWRGLRLLEWLALFATLALTSRISFWSPMPLMFAVFPFAVWAALRFGPRETATAMLLIAAAAVGGLIDERGPFSGGDGELQLLFLVLFIGVMTTTALVLAAATTEREHADTALARVRDELEDRVRERTAELASTNEALKRINLELGRRSQELAAKNEEVESFVYVVSHDLRAPLVNLRGFSEELRTSCSELERTLHQSSLPPPLVEDVERIISSGIGESLRYVTTSSSKLQRLIDSLLVLSRTGREQYHLEPVHVDAVVRSTIDELRGSIAESGARVQVGSLPDVHGDLTAIGQVFANLLSNAIKYRQPTRPCVIEIGGEEQDELCQFWVRDNGAGMNPSSLKRVFQVFQRFHPELAAGEGMGLAIVKRVIERHGGKVWVESQEGVGTTFHLTLPNARGRRTGAWRKIA